MIHFALYSVTKLKNWSQRANKTVRASNKRHERRTSVFVSETIFLRKTKMFSWKIKQDDKEISFIQYDLFRELVVHSQNNVANVFPRLLQ